VLTYTYRRLDVKERRGVCNVVVKKDGKNVEDGEMDKQISLEHLHIGWSTKWKAKQGLSYFGHTMRGSRNPLRACKCKWKPQ